MDAEGVDIGNVKEPLLSFSVALVFIYMLLIALYHGNTDNNDKDEDFIGCHCRHKDKSFYKVIFILFTVIWGCAVIVWFVVRLFSFLVDKNVISKWLAKKIKCYHNEENTSYKLFWVIYILLEPLSFLAHLGVLPLLFLQFLNTYAWVCVFGDNYCREDEASNQLQIDRTGVLFGFLFCATLIGLATNMIERYNAKEK